VKAEEWNMKASSGKSIDKIREIKDIIKDKVKN